MEGYGQFVNGGTQAGDLRSLGGALVNKTSEPASSMEVVMRGLAERVERLSIVVQGVEQRFCSVVRPDAPTPASAPERQRGSRSASSLGNNIENVTQQIEQLADRLQSMVQRCEL